MLVCGCNFVHCCSCIFCLFLCLSFLLTDGNVDGVFRLEFIAFYMLALRRILVGNILFGSVAG
jgi:hypothetical protein